MYNQKLRSIILATLLLAIHTHGHCETRPPALVGQWGSGTYRELCRMGSFLFCIAEGTGIHIYNISEPDNPQLISSIPRQETLLAVAQQNRKLFIGNENGELLIYDILNPYHPEFIKSYQSFPYPVMDLLLDGNFLYMILGGSYLEVLNITDVYHPYQITRRKIGNSSRGTLEKQNNRIYMGSGIYVYLLDVSDPGNPIPKGTIDVGDYVRDTVSFGDNLCVATTAPFIPFGKPFSIWDISDMENPSLLSELPNVNFVTSLGYSDPYVFATSDDFLSVDISEPSDPEIVGTTDLPKHAQHMIRVDNLFWIANWAEGLTAVDITIPNEPFLHTQTGQSMSPNLIGLIGDTALLSGRGDPFSLLDISNPAAPFRKFKEEVQYLDSLGTWGDFVFKGTGAYVQTWDYWLDQNPSFLTTQSVAADQQILLDGLAIFAGGTTVSFTDTTNMLNPQLLSQLELPATIDTLDAVSPFAYLTDSSGTFHIVNFEDTSAPSVIASLQLDITATDIKAVRNRVFLTSVEGQVQSLNIANPTAPVLMNPLPVPEDTVSLDIRYPELALARQTGEIMFLNIRESGTPAHISSISNNIDPEMVVYYGNSLLVTGGSGNDGRFLVIDSPRYHSGYFLLPHIAHQNGWETYLIAENPSQYETQLTLRTADEGGEPEETLTISIPAGQTTTIPLGSGEMGELQTGEDGFLHIQIGYRHTVEQGIASFRLDDDPAKVIHFNMPSYLTDHLTWMGIALSNPGDRSAAITLKALDAEGILQAVYKTVLPPHQRITKVLSDLFYGLDWRIVSRIKAESTEMINGICISGNGNKQLLFTEATTADAKPDTRYLPHIATQFDYWQNSLILDNTSSVEGHATLTLYAGGETAVTRDYLVSENANMIIDLNEFAEHQVDSGILTNCSASLNARLAYMFKETGGTAEFMTDDDAGTSIVFSLPGYATASLTWMGLALFNTEETACAVTLTAFRDGVEVGTADVDLTGHGKKAFLLQGLFGDDIGTVDRVIATAPVDICGLNICGSNQDRYLFTQTISLD